MEIIASCLLTAVIVLTVTLLLTSRRQKQLTSAASEAIQALRSLEKESHLKEMAYLEDKKAYFEEVRSQMEGRLEDAKHEGVLAGRKESAHEHQTHIQQLALDHQRNIIKERTEAASDASTRTRDEMEQQVKLFSIKISPYAKIIKDTGLIYNSHQAEVGYQYQLLVNGIPAFAPHLIIENKEDLREINEARVEALTQKAVELAKFATETYLSGAGKNAVSMAKPIIQHVGK
jgi:hypothetical protein